MMYWNDHAPPHFHALFAEHRAVIDIETLRVTGGSLPKPKLRAVLKDSLNAAWHQTQAGLPASPVA